MIDPDTFRAVLGRFATSVTIVTARDANGTDHGMTVSAFSSVSLEPPLVLVCIGFEASMYPVLRDATLFGVSILSSAQEHLSRRFADPQTDRFEGVAIARGASGVALLDGALAHMECRLVDRRDAGDHMILIAAVDRASTRDGGGDPLLHYCGEYRRLGR